MSNASAWFEEEDEDKLATALQDTTSTLEASPYEAARRESLLYDLELFLGVKLSSLYQLNGVDMSRTFADANQIAFNLCYSITNTIRNRICSFRPRAQFLPDGGDLKAKRAAREMTELSDGWAQRENYQDEASFAFRDLLTGDGGCLKLYLDNVDEKAKKADIKIARFPSWEFMADEAEGIYREPMCKYHCHYLPVEHASRAYGIDELELRRYVVSMPQGIVYVANREMVRVIDAWYRGPNGKHAIVCGPKAKVVEDWEYDGFPVIQKVFDERPVGMWGDGVVKRLRALQIELKNWQDSVREAHALSSQQVWLDREDEGGSAPSKLNNAVIRRATYTNVAPQVINPAAINGEMYKYYETLTAAGYSVIGVSQFIAAGTKQPGINSAVAIRESSELQTDRLALSSQTWETMRVESAEWWRRFASGLVKDGYQVRYRAIRRGTFVELSMENAERDYEIRAFPSSLFGQTISGRLERATELIQGGFLSKTDAMKALDIPDLSPIVDLELSEAYAMETLLDGILEEGKWDTPDPEIDPIALDEYSRKRYLLTKSDGYEYPEENLAMCRRLRAYIKPLAAKARAAMAAPPGGAPPPAATNPEGASPESIQAEQTPSMAA